MTKKMMDEFSEKSTILIVEDDSGIRETLVEVLEMVEYKVVTATNGRDAIEMLLAGLKPSLILLDMLMPIMGGREFLNRVSNNSSLCEIPIIVISASAHREETDGAIAFVKKPVDLNLLLQTIEENSLSA